MDKNWYSISYLKDGSSAQQKAFEILSTLKVLEVLAPYKAVLTGTFPLDLAIPGSDLDICCECSSLADLAHTCQKYFATQENFAQQKKNIGDEPTLLIRFYFKGVMIEIFGQTVPVQEQHSFRHMVAEHILLQQYGEPLRKQVLELKKAGYKTEPAFAKALSLEGNPYENLLQFCS